MSDVPKRPIEQVRPIAEKIIGALGDYCERIEIAGSIRREKPMVGDIEILAIPNRNFDLLGEPLPHTPLDDYLDSMISAGKISHGERKRWGQKMKSFRFSSTTGQAYKVDLFIQTPETWGVNMMIRTGCEEFSRGMVTQKRKGGLCPDDLFFKDARLWRVGDDDPLSTAEEDEVFYLLEQPYVPPSERGPKI